MAYPRAAVVVSVLAVLLAVAHSLPANELTVDARTLRMNDMALVTVTLEGGFAHGDAVGIPLQNLAFVSEPSVSSEFAWMNGRVSRRRIFRYRVRPLAPGPAQVGPVEIVSDEGQSERLQAVVLQVTGNRTSVSNDAETVLRDVLASGREPFFVVAEVEKTSVYAGEPVVITWVMYNAAVVQQWHIANVPKVPDFWSEELIRSDTPERTYLGDVMVQRLPIRRVALFPLRSGQLQVEGLTVEAEVMRRIRSGPFSLFEGQLVDAVFTSAPVALDVKPLPAGPPVDAVGDFVLTCEPPVQRGDGPVLVRVALSGAGNARAAVPPRFTSSVPGKLQIEGGQVAVSREGQAIMTRRWQYLIFPAADGTLEIPALSMRVFAPAAGERRELRCEGATLEVIASSKPVVPVPATPAASRAIAWPWFAGGGALLLGALLVIPRGLRELRLRRETRTILRDAGPAEIRVRMEARVAIDLSEHSDRGDAWRALRSLLDAAERERALPLNIGREIERRIRDVLRLA